MKHAVIVLPTYNEKQHSAFLDEKRGLLLRLYTGKYQLLKSKRRRL